MLAFEVRQIANTYGLATYLTENRHDFVPEHREAQVGRLNEALWSNLIRRAPTPPDVVDFEQVCIFVDFFMQILFCFYFEYEGESHVFVEQNLAASAANVPLVEEA